MNAVQRRYPQIYQSNDRLLLKPETIAVGLRDFMVAIKSTSYFYYHLNAPDVIYRVSPFFGKIDILCCDASATSVCSIVK